MSQTADAPPPIAYEAHPPAPRRGIPYFRWVIGFMLFLAAILNYVDRQALALLKPTISADLGLTDADYARINNYFLVAYLIAYLVSGRLVDKWGPRISMTVFIAWWSISNALTGFARSASSLAICRFSLGLGEAGNWPASAKAVREWFPAKERAIAIGFYTLGATLGATIAPMLIIGLHGHFAGWQPVFVVTGLAGLLWIVPWWFIYRKPSESRQITERDLRELQASEQPPTAEEIADDATQTELGRWKAAFSLKAVWLLMFARMLTDPVWYFYQFWFPSYLYSDRGVSQGGLAVTTFVYLAADVGTLLGGFGSAYLIRRRYGAASSRLWVMLACACIVPLSPLVTRMPTIWGSMAIAMLVCFAHLAWLANISALIVDVIPRRIMATCFGIAAAGSALGGIFMNDLVAGFAKDKNYATWFVIMAFLHPIAWAILYFGGIHRRGTPTASPPAAAPAVAGH